MVIVVKELESTQGKIMCLMDNLNMFNATQLNF